MNPADPAPWLNTLLGLLHGLQTGGLALLHWLGLTGELQGQPAWPFAQRIAAETLRIDGGHARQVAISLTALGLVLLLCLLALAWQRRRGLCLALGVLTLLLTRWPEPRVLLTEATPTSFHQAPAPFLPASILRGQGLFLQHCAACHGADAQGEGPLAASLAMWPPSLNGALLWRRLDGELFWRVREGLHDPRGRPTMPGFGQQLGTEDTWAVLDFLKANAAGQSLARTGSWPQPVRAPALAFHCGNTPLRQLDSLQGQRLRISVLRPGDPAPQEDPRLLSLALPAVPSIPATPGSSTGDCEINDPQAAPVLALLAGVSTAELPGHQFIVDRDGWLRARSRPGQALWSDTDLVCTTNTRPNRPDTVASTPAAPIDGLARLIDRMDKERVSLVKGGFVH